MKSFMRLVLLSALVIGTRAFAVETSLNSDAAAKIAEIEKRAGGRLGVAALDTGTKRRIDIARRNDSRCAAPLN
jgi:hypothetical protein